MKGFENLPASQIAGEVNEKLAHTQALVISAPPGAGKSTLLPLTILEGFNPKGKIIVLEPRRLAARQIAERMASMLEESIGETVGFRIRFETRVSARTKIEVITEGILSRMLISDPTLDGVDVIIFDEFHERSLDSDLALAMTREIAGTIRPDLKLVLMSATIDSDAICEAIGAESVHCEGRMFPVQIRHSATDCTVEDCAGKVASTVREALKSENGDILAFLPGEAEIRKCADFLKELPCGVQVYPLYGMLSPVEQKMAISPSPAGRRKVVLATPIAETSLTIEGVSIVVDSGFCRRMKFNPINGMNSLETVRISMDMATQRSGRAGRVCEGICHRLWTASTELRMENCRKAEILSADLCPAMLSVTASGICRIENLPWLTPPPALQLRKAEKILKGLGALNEKGGLTPHGQRLSSLPCHPRIANMLTASQNDDIKTLACDIAAILEERDPIEAEAVGTDLNVRVEEMRRIRSNNVNVHGRWVRIIAIAEQYRKMLGLGGSAHNGPFSPEDTGMLVASAYPERVAQNRGGGHFLLSSGDLASMDARDPLAAEEYLAVASMSGREGGEGRIFLCSPVNPAGLPCLSSRDVVCWSPKELKVVARREIRAGRLLISSSPLVGVTREDIIAAIVEASEKEGLRMFDFNEGINSLFLRIATVSSWHPELDIPELNVESILSRTAEWLPLYAGKASTAAELKRIDIEEVVWGLLGYELRQQIDRIAPTHIEVPTGSRIRVEYRQGAESPVVRVRLQECFGMMDTPKVDGGRRSVLMELLSPGFKPVQLTSDLRSFWSSTYFDVRKELRARYPRHSWPENPMEAVPVKGVKKR